MILDRESPNRSTCMTIHAFTNCWKCTLPTSSTSFNFRTPDGGATHGCPAPERQWLPLVRMPRTRESSWLPHSVCHWAHSMAAQYNPVWGAGSSSLRLSDTYRPCVNTVRLPPLAAARVPAGRTGFRTLEQCRRCQCRRFVGCPSIATLCLSPSITWLQTTRKAEICQALGSADHV